jgi:hypothetical protein
MRNRIEKFTLSGASSSIALDLQEQISLMIRLRKQGHPVYALAADLADLIVAEVHRVARHVVTSPYQDVSDSDWREAYEEAAQDIYEREDIEREPTQEEIDHALESITERRNEERTA